MSQHLSDTQYRNFNLPDFVDAAFKELRSDVTLPAGVTIGMFFRDAEYALSEKSGTGDYSTSLIYAQSAVSTTTDDSLNLLLPILAQPIVQKIVDASFLG